MTDMHVLAVIETRGKLGRRDTPRPADLKNRMNMRSHLMNTFNEEEEEDEGGEKEDQFDEDRNVFTEQKTITKVYEEVMICNCK